MDTFSDEGAISCYINLPMVHVNAQGPFAYKGAEDVILIGTPYFYNYQGIQYNYETNKVAFLPYPNHGNPEDNDVVPAAKDFPVWLIIVLVLSGVAVLGGIGFYFYQRRKVQSELASAEYDRL